MICKATFCVQQVQLATPRSAQGIGDAWSLNQSRPADINDNAYQCIAVWRSYPYCHLSSWKCHNKTVLGFDCQLKTDPLRACM